MRFLWFFAPATALTFLLTAEARSQYGLYGAPDPLPIGVPAAAPSGATHYTYPSTSAVRPVVGYAAPANNAAPAVPMSYAYTAEPKEMEMPEEPAPPIAPAPAAVPTPAKPAPKALPAAPVEPDRIEPTTNYPATVAPAATGGASAVDQMFNAPGGACSAGQSGCEASGCGGCFTECCRSPWYFSVYALSMGRDNPNGVWTTYQTGNEPNQLLKTSDVTTPWQWGGGIRFGRRFCCDQWALEGVFWGLNQQTASTDITSPTGVSTPLVVSDVQFGAETAQDWFDGAAAHRVSRDDTYYNVEINVTRRISSCSCDNPLDASWLMGARYFRFDESLNFATCRNGFTWGQDPAAEASIADSIENNLVGFQIGFDGNYYLCNRLSLFVTPKIGIYNNHIQNNFRMSLADGTVANTGSSGVTGTYPVQSSTDRIAFMGELDLGLDWHFANAWSARVGYRVLAATGIGLADNQIPFYAVDIPEISSIDTNGDLILHGAFAGITYNF